MQITEHLRTISDNFKAGVNKVQLVASDGVNLNTPTIASAEITRLANVTAYEAGDTINNTVSVKQKETITFTGTNGTLNVNVGGLTLLATFDTSIGQTAINFESAHVLDVAAVGITMTRELEVIVLEATTAGDPFATATVELLTGDLEAEIAIVAANVTNVATVVEDIVSSIGVYKTVDKIVLKTNMQGFAGKTVITRLWNGTVTSVSDDNVPATDTYADDLITQISVVFGLASNGVVRGEPATQPSVSFLSKSLDIPVTFVATEAITPTSGGKLYVELTVV